MTVTNFKALVVEKKEEAIVANVKECQVDLLSPGETLINVHYSAVNYKDALATIEGGGVIRSYPMIPGIDLVGEIIETTASKFKKGDWVVVTGNGTGVTHTGGFSEIARIPNEWLLRLPKHINPKEAVIIGTAGITAAEAVKKLEIAGLDKNKNARILVTGATGGVGSFGIALLSSLGYNNITALSRKEDTTYLTQLGAKDVVKLEDISPEKASPLQKQQFDYVLDTIGGAAIATILPQINYGGAIALCGNASGIKFTTTVLPFILRGISMLGVDSVALPNEEKEMLWQRLTVVIDKSLLSLISGGEESLDTVLDVIADVLEGKHSGRTVIKL